MSASEKGLRAVDTNVLVRLFTSDDARQFEAVKELVRDTEQAGEALYVSHIVLAEMVWVLARNYKFGRALVVDRIEQLMAAPNVVIERDMLVAHALDQYRRGPADFADYLIGAIALDAGCRDTVTFDGKLEAMPGFTVLE
ncbi:MAG: type II toxin-antitoxin system VapC family toxin [Acidobacteriota bacterium]